MQSTVVSPFTRLRSELQHELLAGYDELIARTTWDHARIRRHQRERLDALLRHAAAHSPFHADRLAGLDPSDLGPEDLSALPVMTKAELMAEFDDVVTDRRVTRAAAEDALAAVDDEPAVVGGRRVGDDLGRELGPAWRLRARRAGAAPVPRLVVARARVPSAGHRHSARRPAHRVRRRGLVGA